METLAQRNYQFLKDLVDFVKYNRALHNTVYLFILFLLYLIIGTVTIWTIEKHFPFPDFTLGESLEDSLDRLWQDQYLPKEEWKNQILIAFSRWTDQNNFDKIRSWTLFDSAFFCYGLATGSGCYSEMEPKTSAGKIFSMIYSLFMLPLALLLTGYLSELINYFFRGVGLAVGRIADMIIELMTDMPQSNGFDKFFFEQEEWWLYSVILLMFYCGFGTWIFVYRGPYPFTDVFYSSFIAFATLNVGKPFLDSCYAFQFLIYLLCGIAVFQNCVRVIQADIRKWMPKLPHSPFVPSDSTLYSSTGTGTTTETGSGTETNTSNSGKNTSSYDYSSSEGSEVSKKGKKEKKKKAKSKK